MTLGFCFASNINSGRNSETNIMPSESTNSASIVFRGKQVFRNSKNNQEIYCYTNGKCEWYENDRLDITCTYTVDGSDIKFLDEDGDVCYKGYISWNDSHSKPLSITINRTTYYNKN